MLNFMKIRTVGAEFHNDGRTEPIFAFRSFANVPKNRQAMVRYRSEERKILLGANIHDGLQCLRRRRGRSRRRKKEEKTYGEPDESIPHPPSIHVFILDSF